MRDRRYRVEILGEEREPALLKAAVYTAAAALGAGLGYWFEGLTMALVFGLIAIGVLYLVLNE